MFNNSLFVLIVAVATLFINSQNTYSQAVTDEKKFEAGGQFSVLQAGVPGEARFTGVVCVTTPCPSFAIVSSRQSQPGFGGRIGYNLSANFAIEGELNIFPNADSFSAPDEFKGGHKLEGLVGVKAGKRFDKVGIFGKARPGFLYTSKGDLRPRANSLCLAIFPTPAGCFETTSKTNLAFDLGGVVEIYPTRRTIIRFDAGDTIVRLSERNVAGVISPLSSFVTVIRAPAETTHNFQGSIGIGFRF